MLELLGVHPLTSRNGRGNQDHDDHDDEELRGRRPETVRLMAAKVVRRSLSERSAAGAHP